MDFHNNGRDQASFRLNHNYVRASLDPTCDVSFVEFFWCKRTHGRIPQVELMVVRKHVELFTQYHHNWRSNITSELTRRREFNQASPDESSCKTRPRRSRPTICYAAMQSEYRSTHARYILV